MKRTTTTSKIIKYTILVITALGVAYSIVYFTKGLNDSEDKPIATTPFTKEVESKTTRLIKGKSYSEAKRGFTEIMQSIQTEASVTLEGGGNLLSEEDVRDARRIAFYEYTPIFTKYGKDYFIHASWDKSEIQTLKTEALNLKSLGIADASTTTDKDISYIIQTVDDYNAAWGVANSASRCSTVEGISQLKKKAGTYMHAPLTNNASLKAALQSVESNAKASVVNVIAGYVSGIASHYTTYYSYAEWGEKYTMACKRIKEYTSKYGSNNRLSDAQAKLDGADSSAYSYYNNKNQNQ